MNRVKNKLVIVVASLSCFILLSADSHAGTLVFASGAAVITADDVSDGTTGEQTLVNSFAVPQFNTSWGTLVAAEWEVDCSGLTTFSMQPDDASSMGESYAFQTEINIDPPDTTLFGDAASGSSAAGPFATTTLNTANYYPNGDGQFDLDDVDNAGFVTFTAITTYTLSAGQNFTTTMSGGWFAQGSVEYRFTPALPADGAGATVGGQNVPDGVVSQADLDLVLNNWGYGAAAGETAYWNDGDFSGDGKVAQADLDLVLNNWGQSIP